MTDATQMRERPLPRSMPMLLSFVAGYVDSYTYLALFGLFAAQVTGSFVIGAAELVQHEYGIIGKILAILGFVTAAAVTAGLIAGARGRGVAELPWMLALETALLAVFVAIVLFGPPVTGARDWHGIVSGIFAAMAMGAQSVLVRLLMKGYPQTNVMTGNTTQLGIETMDLILAWRRRARAPGDADVASEFAAVKKRLKIVASVALGFLVGAAAGAIAFAGIGVPGALLAVAIVALLALWALYRERQKS
jgi:uncharacterized membrane protein YoaK (UPF0700 family)